MKFPKTKTELDNNVSRLNPLMDKDFLFDCINNDIRFKESHPEIKEGKLYLSIE